MDSVEIGVLAAAAILIVAVLWYFFGTRGADRE
jgi:hypothetical protein